MIGKERERKSVSGTKRLIVLAVLFVLGVLACVIVWQ